MASDDAGDHGRLPLTKTTRTRPLQLTAAWKVALEGVKKLHGAGQYKQCAARSAQLLMDLTGDEINSLHPVYLHIYAATSIEMTARVLHPLASTKMALLLQSKGEYERAIDAIALSDDDEDEDRYGDRLDTQNLLHPEPTKPLFPIGGNGGGIITPPPSPNLRLSTAMFSDLDSSSSHSSPPSFTSEDGSHKSEAADDADVERVGREEVPHPSPLRIRKVLSPGEFVAGNNPPTTFLATPAASEVGSPTTPEITQSSPPSPSTPPPFSHENNDDHENENESDDKGEDPSTALTEISAFLVSRAQSRYDSLLSSLRTSLDSHLRALSVLLASTSAAQERRSLAQDEDGACLRGAAGSFHLLHYTGMKHRSLCRPFATRPYHPHLVARGTGAEDGEKEKEKAEGGERERKAQGEEEDEGEKSKGRGESTETTDMLRLDRTLRLAVLRSHGWTRQRFDPAPYRALAAAALAELGDITD